MFSGGTDSLCGTDPIVIASQIVLGLQTYDDLVENYGETLNTLDHVFLGIFCVELVLRIASYRRPLEFFRSGWNVFDFVVISLAFVPGLRESTTLLRLARRDLAAMGLDDGPGDVQAQAQSAEAPAAGVSRGAHDDRAADRSLRDGV